MLELALQKFRSAFSFLSVRLIQFKVFSSLLVVGIAVILLMIYRSLPTSFIPNEDQAGNDIYYHKLSIYECMKIAENDPYCVGFNTQGFFKNKITNLTKSKYFSTSDGIYIKKNKIIILPFNEE
jgi:hypothetical protein